MKLIYKGGFMKKVLYIFIGVLVLSLSACHNEEDVSHQWMDVLMTYEGNANSEVYEGEDYLEQNSDIIFLSTGNVVFGSSDHAISKLYSKDYQKIRLVFNFDEVGTDYIQFDSIRMIYIDEINQRTVMYETYRSAEDDPMRIQQNYDEWIESLEKLNAEDIEDLLIDLDVLGGE
jgi:hypothetical protein